MKLHRVLIISTLVLCASVAGCVSGGIRHGWMMRGQVLAIDGGEATVCVGSLDGAVVDQVLSVQHLTLKYRSGSRGQPSVTRSDGGQLRITRLFDDHYALAQTVRGNPAVNDVVELELK